MQGEILVALLVMLSIHNLDIKVLICATIKDVINTMYFKIVQITIEEHDEKLNNKRDNKWKVGNYVQN